MEGATRTGLGGLWLAIKAVCPKLPRGGRLVRRGVVTASVVAAVAGAPTGAAAPARPNDPSGDHDSLWKIVHDRCEIGYQRTGAYAPCALVDEASGTAVFKGAYDPYDFLLLPLARVTGSEDPALQESTGRNYLYDAWAARFLLTSRLNNSLPESDVVLTVNPKNMRTQDQLHIHISCASPTTSAVLKNIDASEYVRWNQLPIDLNGHTYEALAVSRQELESKNLFQDVYMKVTADHTSIENAGIAVANVAPEQFLLLVAEGTEDQPVKADTIQDRECSIAKAS
jgi:CDP-diacylglycerol pyrophosphatase